MAFSWVFLLRWRDNRTDVKSQFHRLLAVWSYNYFIAVIPFLAFVASSSKHALALRIKSSPLTRRYRSPVSPDSVPVRQARRRPAHVPHHAVRAPVVHHGRSGQHIHHLADRPPAPPTPPLRRSRPRQDALEHVHLNLGHGDRERRAVLPHEPPVYCVLRARRERDEFGPTGA